MPHNAVMRQHFETFLFDTEELLAELPQEHADQIRQTHGCMPEACAEINALKEQSKNQAIGHGIPASGVEQVKKATPR